MKRIAIPVFKNQMAAVLDYSRSFVLVALDGELVWGRLKIPVSPKSPEMLLRALEGFQVDVLICGAVSSSLLESLARRGIEVITYVRGTVNQVIAAYAQGKLVGKRFRLPGLSASPRNIRSEAGRKSKKSSH